MKKVLEKDLQLLLDDILKNQFEVIDIALRKEVVERHKIIDAFLKYNIKPTEHKF